MLGLLAVCLAAVLVVLLLTSASRDQTRATVAADLAALAASDAARGVSEGDPCALAAQVASRNGTTVVACSVSPGAPPLSKASAHVSVVGSESPGFGWLPLPHSEAQAWAGAPG